jgi:L-iditol 2-dehydrogenase
VRVTAVGICGSDLHWLTEGGIGDATLEKPLVLGHEFAGVIVNGGGSRERVAVDPAVPCEKCEFCQKGHPNLCLDLVFAGHSPDDGALREFMSWPRRHLYPLPESLSNIDGAMLEPLGIAIHTVDLAHLRSGMSVGVFGCGPIGLLIMQVARAAGVTQVIATDKLDHRLEAACSMGASVAIKSYGGAENPEVWSATNRCGVDVAFEAAGENEAVETAVYACKPGGKVILVGIPDDDKTTFTASQARRKGLTMKLVRRMKHTYPRAIELVQSGLVDVRSLVTHRFPLERYQDAFSVAEEREGIKVIIEL